MSLDLGSLVGEVRLDATLFETTYVRVVRQMAELGAKAGAAAAGTSTLDRSLAEAGASANAASAGLGRADRALAGAGVSASEAAVATEAMHASTTQAALASSRLTQAVLRQSAAQARLSELEATGSASSRQLAGARASLIAANDRVALSTERLGKATGFQSEAWQSAGRGMLVAGGLIAAGMVIAGKAAADFDAKMTLVRTLAKASPADMAQLRSAALTVGQAYGYSAGEVADAEAELVKAGVSVKDIMGGALTGALTLAAAGQEDVAAATNTAAVAMTQFQLSGKDVPHIADLLAAGADKALGSVADLSEALSYGGVAAHQAGMSIEETVGILAMLAQSGQLGSVAGSQLAQMLRNLEAPTSRAKAEMKNLGIQVYGSGGQMLSMATIADELHNKIGKLPPAQRDAALAALFTARSVRAANILMRDGGDAVREWTKRVDDSGFAALQASGKLDSLSGDLTKLKSALNAAFIGAGENAQGPLRSIVQDVTSVITVWQHLPGPVKDAIEVLVGVAGAASLIGGAALLLIPRIHSMNEGLQSLSGGAMTAGGALSGLAKAAAVAGAIVGLAIALHALHEATMPAGPDLDKMANALVDFGQKGVVAGELSKTFGTNLDKLGSLAKKIADEGAFGKIGDDVAKFEPWARGSGAEQAKKDFDALDKSLNSLVTSGNADVAAASFQQISAKLHAAGLSTAQITALFPQYADALNASAASAKAAGTGVDKYGNAVSSAAKKTQAATDAAKAYSDALHALADPLFAMNQALSDLRDKQTAASAAVKKYGANSREARAANLDLASAALNVAAASKALTASVKNGTTSLAGAKAMLHSWVAAGLITKKQADAVAAAFGGIITKADKVSGAIDRSAGGAKKAASKFGAAGNEAADSYAAGVAKTEVKAINAAAHMHKLSYQAAAKAGDFVQAGANAAQGFADGISSGEIKAINAAVHMGKISAQAAAKAIESRSPSRVFAALGVTVPQGFAVGITSGLGLVEAAVKAMASTATAAATGAAKTVYATIAAAVAPSVTNPTALARILASGTGAAVSKQSAADAAQASYTQLAARAAQLAAQLKDVKAATAAHARALADEAAAAHTAAANMTSHTKAEAAAKHAAEEHARALSLEARAAATAASASGAAVKAAQTAADAAAAAASKAKGSFDTLAQSAKDAAQTAADAAGKLVQSLQDATDQMAQQVSAFQSQISSGIAGDTSLSSIWQQLSGTDANGNPLTPTLAGVQSTFDGILASAQQFSTDLNALVAEGGDQDLVSQIAGMGTQAGDALAQQLLAAGPTAVAALQTTMDAITSVADMEGDKLSGAFYGKGVNALAQLVAGMESQFPELKDALAQIVATIDSMLGPAVTAAIAGSGGGDQLGLLPHFAAGVRGFGGGLAVVGEHGSEVVRLPHGADVYPHGGDGASLFDQSAVIDRLERIEARLADAPALTGQAVGAASVDGYRAAGREHAQMTARLQRKL